MNLHRVGRMADWDVVAPKDRTIWQRMAAWSHGWLTTGNMATVAGAGLTLAGLYEISQQRMVRGVGLIAVGRAMDVVDGWLADKTGTKGPVGEALDAGSDKLLSVSALAIGAVTGYMPILAAGGLLAEQVALTSAAIIAKQRDVELHPTKSGKLAMFAGWIGIGGFVAGEALSQYVSIPEMASQTVEAAAWVATGVSMGLGGKASFDYFRATFSPHTTNE